jgi:hypothetical protein
VTLGLIYPEKKLDISQDEVCFYMYVSGIKSQAVPPEIPLYSKHRQSL